MMTNLLLFAFIAYGMSTILVYGSIFEGTRNWIHSQGKKNKVGLFFSELISCMLCTSTWVGFLLSLTMFSPSGSIYSISLPFSIFFDGMYSAGIVWSINAIIEWFENK